MTLCTSAGVFELSHAADVGEPDATNWAEASEAWNKVVMWTARDSPLAAQNAMAEVGIEVGLGPLSLNSAGTILRRLTSTR